MQLTSTQRKAIDHYYNELEAYHDHKVTHETAVRSAFQNLLAAFAQSANWNPKRQKNRSCLPPTWTAQELGKRTSIERFFGRIFPFFHRITLPPLCGWSAITTRVALTYTASIVGLAAHQAGRPDLIRSRHSHARPYVGGLLNDEMRSRNLSEWLYFFQPML